MSYQSIHFANKPVALTDNKKVSLVRAARNHYYMPNPNNNCLIDYYNNMVIVDETEGDNNYSPGMFLMRQHLFDYSKSQYGSCTTNKAFRTLVLNKATPTVPLNEKSISQEEMFELLSAIETQFAEMTAIMADLINIDDDDCLPMYALGDDSADPSEFHNHD